ncbi:MAG: hydrogenase 4 subunit F [Vulcanibacillus sp.]
MELVFIILPLLALPLFWLVNNKKFLHIINIITSTSILIFGLVVISRVSENNIISSELFLSFYIDSLNALVIGIVIILSFLISIYSVGYLDIEFKNNTFDIKKIKLFYILFYCFEFTMLLALTNGNIGIIWVAIEATTLSTVFLVGFYNDKKAIEAAWKYIIICSTGIALALLGIIFLHLSSVDIVGGTNSELSWLYLYDNAGELNELTLRLSFIFILIGFGTKAGLAPMHTWLPDAHSQAPSPISAMLSGILLNSAMYGVIRELSIVNKSFGDSVFTGRLMMGLGILSILTAAVFIIRQKDYKRMLAYSSIEHMGIIAFSLGMFTPLSIFAALLHMISHSFTKTLLFLSSGNIYLKYETKKISNVRGLLKTLPFTGTVFLLGLFAITGMPPFSIFYSELNVLIATFTAGYYVLGTIFILLLALVFVGIAVSAFKMFYGTPGNIKSGEINMMGVFVIIILLIFITVTGVFLPEFVIDLITDAQQIISGSAK